MNTEYLAASRAFPPFFFVFDEMPFAKFTDVIEIFDHAHAILGSIPVIQIFQPGTREAVATEAILGFGVYYLLAVFDQARNANFRLEAVVAKAAGAWFLIPRVS